MEAVTISAPRRPAPAATTFAGAAEAYLDDVFGYLLYLTRDRDLADDLSGATFEKALRRWHRFDAKRGSARTWLLGIARTTALDWFRAEARRTRREQAVAPPEAELAPVVEGVSPELEHALVSLSAGEREVIALRVVLDLDAATAASVLGISPTNCTTRLNRALKKLEEAIDVAA